MSEPAPVGAQPRDLLRAHHGHPRRELRRDARQIVTILGANGAGKTTVLKSVCGAMEPQKGSVAFAGRSITGPRTRLGGAPRHRPCARGPGDLPVHDGQGQPADGRLRAQGHATASSATSKWSTATFPILRERAASAAGYLSGGQQQMLAIGRATDGAAQADAAG